jgi:hypothetical protein
LAKIGNIIETSKKKGKKNLHSGGGGGESY